VYFVAKSGRAAAVAVHILPQADKLSQGTLFHRVTPLTDNDSLAAVFALPSRRGKLPEETCVITATKLGMIKKSLVTELPGPSSQTFVLVRVNEGDRLVDVALTDNKTKDILLVTAQGMAIRFKEEEVRPMGLVAAGVNGLKLADQDEVVGMEILPAEGEIFLITSEGKAKRVEQKEFPMQGRYGRGVIAWDLSEKVRLAGVVVDKPNHMATIHLTRGAPKSTRLDEVAIRKRAATKGDVVVDVKPGEEVVSVNVGWTVDKFVEEVKEVKKRPSPNGTGVNGKKPAKAAASPNGRVKKAAPKTSSPKRKSAAKKSSPKKNASKPAKKSGSKKKR
jgi:DNA gyrase subunit A